MRMTVLASSPEALSTPAGLPAEVRNPSAVHVAALAPTGRRSMGQALRAIAEVLAPGVGPAAFPGAEVRYEHAQALRRVLAERYAPATANKVLSALRGVVREAWRLGLVSADTLARIEAVPSVRGERLPAGREVPAGELAALFAACAKAGASGARDAGALALLYGAGLRRSEAVGLELEALTGDGVRVLGKGNKERTVPIPPSAAAALRGWLEVRGNEPGPLLCPVKAGRVTIRRMTAQALMTAILRRGAEANVPHLSPHDLRRSYLTSLLRAGADLSTVQRLAGHANVTTTTRYDRRGADEQAKAAAFLLVPYVGPSRETCRTMPL